MKLENIWIFFSVLFFREPLKHSVSLNSELGYNYICMLSICLLILEAINITFIKARAFQYKTMLKLNSHQEKNVKISNKINNYQINVISDIAQNTAIKAFSQHWCN